LGSGKATPGWVGEEACPTRATLEMFVEVDSFDEPIQVLLRPVALRGFRSLPPRGEAVFLRIELSDLALRQDSFFGAASECFHVFAQAGWSASR